MVGVAVAVNVTVGTGEGVGVEVGIRMVGAAEGGAGDKGWQEATRAMRINRPARWFTEQFYQEVAARALRSFLSYIPGILLRIVQNTFPVL